MLFVGGSYAAAFVLELVVGSTWLKTSSYLYKFLGDAQTGIFQHVIIVIDPMTTLLNCMFQGKFRQLGAHHLVPTA